MKLMSKYVCFSALCIIFKGFCFFKGGYSIQLYMANGYLIGIENATYW